MNQTQNAGNGHGKTFEIIPPRSPEEIEAESKKRLAYVLRDKINWSKHPMACKGFLTALLDLTFLKKFGGDSRGRIFTNVQKLRVILKHNKDSVSKWRDYWIEQKMLWVSRSWPVQEWRLTDLFPAPEPYTGQETLDFLRGSAAAEQSGDLRNNGFSAKNSHSPSVSEEIRNYPPSEPPNSSETFGTGILDLRNTLPRPSAHMCGDCRKGVPKPSETSAETSSKGVPKPSETSADKVRATMETPRSIGASGVIGGFPSPEKQFQDWIKSLEGMYQSNLKLLEKSFIIKLRTAQSPEAKSEWSRRLKIVQDRLLGGPVEDKMPQPVRLDKKPAMDPLKTKRLWEKAKKNLPPALQKKAATTTAAH